MAWSLFVFLVPLIKLCLSWHSPLLDILVHVALLTTTQLLVLQKEKLNFEVLVLEIGLTAYMVKINLFLTLRLVTFFNFAIYISQLRILITSTGLIFQLVALLRKKRKRREVCNLVSNHKDQRLLLLQTFGHL